MFSIIDQLKNVDSERKCFLEKQLIEFQEFLAKRGTQKCFRNNSVTIWIFFTSNEGTFSELETELLFEEFLGKNTNYYALLAEWIPKCKTLLKEKFHLNSNECFYLIQKCYVPCLKRLALLQSFPKLANEKVAKLYGVASQPS